MSRFVRFTGTNAITIIVDTFNDSFNATYSLSTNSKKVSDWMKTAASKKLIKAIVDKCLIDPVNFIKEDNSDFAGTYLHYIAFDAMFVWVDPMYRLDVLAVIEEYRDIKMKSAQSLLCKVDSMLANLALTDYEESAVFSVDKVENNLMSNVERIAQQINNASAKSKPAKSKATKSKPTTSNGRKPSGINYVCLGYDFVDDNGKQCHTLYHIAGTPSNVNKSVENKLNDVEHEWKEIIGMYCRDAVEVRNSIKDRIAEYKADIISKVNEEKLEEIKTHNDALKEEIKQHNKVNLDDKRTFSKEKLTIKKINARNIPIKATKLTSTYTENEYVSYEEFLDIVRGVEPKPVAETSDNETDSETETNHVKRNINKVFDLDSESESEAEKPKRKSNAKAPADDMSEDGMSDDEDYMSDVSL